MVVLGIAGFRVFDKEFGQGEQEAGKDGYAGDDYYFGE
jgi:hypothetical protein